MIIKTTGTLHMNTSFVINKKVSVEVIEILMCWFHFKQNIRKNRLLIPRNNYANTLKQCNNLHNCTSTYEFNVNVLFESHYFKTIFINLFSH